MRTINTEETNTAPPEPTDATEAMARRRVANTRRQVWMFSAILALLSAASLILLLTITGGEEIDVVEADVTVLSQTDVTDALRREAAGPAELELEMLYTPRWYFSWSGRSEPVTDGVPTLAFFMFEITHDVDLPEAAPTVTITSSSGTYDVASAEIVTDSPHHRVSQLFFDAETADGAPIVAEDEALVVNAVWPDGHEASVNWQPPMPFGLAALNADTDTSTAFTFQSPALSLGAIAAIFGGMLAALSPCLLLLAAYYTSVLSGAAAVGSDRTLMDRSTAERKLLTTGLFFVTGFTAVYTAGGVVAGYVGDSIGRIDNIGSYARPASIFAGIAVILMGVRMASQAKVPVACKIPVFNRPTQSGWVGSAVMGSTFAVGCLSCFSATVLTALLLYAGATGSPLAGGLVMLMFSAGVGVMFLVAAVLVARAAPLSTWLAKAQPAIGAVSALFMIGMGILMVTYKFHLVTGKLFELWS